MTLTECKIPLHLRRWTRQFSVDNKWAASRNSLMGDGCGIRSYQTVLKTQSGGKFSDCTT